MTEYLLCAFLDSFFTERYIPQNDDYLRAISDADLTIRAGNLESRNFLLVHGTADTLVHPQHSLMLTRAMIQQDITFRHQVSHHTFVSDNRSFYSYLF